MRKVLNLLFICLALWSSAPAAWAQLYFTPVPIRAPKVAGAIGAPVILISVASFSPGAASGSASAAMTVDAPIGSTIIAGVNPSSPLATILTVVDSAGNTYALSQSAGSASVDGSAVAYSINTTHDLPIGGTLTVTTSDGGPWTGWAVWKIANANNGADKSVNTAGSSTTFSLSSGTLTQAIEIAITSTLTIGSGSGVTFTESSGFTNLTGAGAGSFGGMSYKITAATTALAYAPSWTPTGPYSSAMVTLKN